jgi:hypothetical protein
MSVSKPPMMKSSPDGTRSSTVPPAGRRREVGVGYERVRG